MHYLKQTASSLHLVLNNHQNSANSTAITDSAQMGKRSTSHVRGGRFIGCRGGMLKPTLQLAFCPYFDEY